METKKMLVAYFSCSGVTASAARTLAAATGADVYEIRPAVPYTDADLNWMDKKSRTTLEQNDPASRPAMAGRAPVEGYDVIFVGYPIWWYGAPRIISTFLEGGGFAGKTIVPFCTSGGSGVGTSDLELHACCGAARWRPGKLLRGGISADELAAWVHGLAL